MSIFADAAKPAISIPEYAILIGARLANEGVPVNVIARAIVQSASDVRDMLQECIDVGSVLDMPPPDWPPTGKRSDHIPQPSFRKNEQTRMFACQRSMGLTKLEAAFMMVLLRKDEADKDALHHVIEQERASRQSRLDNSEPTHPKMVDVVICKLRKKLSLKGIEIQTLWGRGYYIADEGRLRAHQLMTEFIDADQPNPERSDDYSGAGD